MIINYLVWMGGGYMVDVCVGGGGRGFFTWAYEHSVRLVQQPVNLLK